MSLKLLQPGIQPLGQFDCVDGQLTSFKGGEICSFGYVQTNSQPGVTTAGLDQAAYDVFDGYVNNGTNFVRPAVSKNWATTGTAPLFTGSVATANAALPVFLSDDGITGYGTLFGTVVGGTVGQVAYGPNSVVAAANLLGPHTATGSGKMTLWDKPGLYAVSLDAVDTSTTGGHVGLIPSNTALVGGDALSFTATGLLTPNTTAAPGNAVVPGHLTVGRFIEFNTNGSLVTTPNYLVAALNSPSGNVSSLQTRAFTFATVYFVPSATNI